MADLFAYGTLMCEEIMLEVTGCRLAGEPGTLRGYSRRSVKGEHFPALLADADAVVEGIVYSDLPASAWVLLNRFEGDFYRLRPVQVQLHAGSVRPVLTYVVQPLFLDQLDPSGWDFANFVRHHQSDFLTGCQGFSRR